MSGKEVTIKEARLHCERMAKKQNDKKENEKEDCLKRQRPWLNKSILAPFSDEGRNNYAEIFGHH